MQSFPFLYKQIWFDFYPHIFFNIICIYSTILSLHSLTLSLQSQPLPSAFQISIFYWLLLSFVFFLSQHIDKSHILRYNRITLCTALHSLWNARSTVQTEQAMTLGHGAGPLKGGSRSHTMHLWDSCMFHRCVFFTFWERSISSWCQ